MKKYSKKIISCVLIVILSIAMLVPVSANGEINVYLDGEKIQFDVAPLLVNGRTMVPMRAIFEKLGAAVHWDGTKQEASAHKGDIIVKISIGDTILHKNEESIKLDVPAQLISGRTLVPLRAVSEAFGCDVQWDGSTQTVNILSKKEPNGPSATPPSIPTTGDIWDGTTLQPSVMVQKDGMFFYQISSCEELAYIAVEQGEWLEYNYILANNLILNDVELTCDEYGNCANTETLLEWTPIDGFAGVFDGDGFTVSGMYINQKEENEIGLFGFVSGTPEDMNCVPAIYKNATIKNLTVVNSYVCGNKHVGGIVGYFGILWSERDSLFENCMFAGTVLAQDKAGGLLGYSTGGYGFSNLTNYGTIYADLWVGGITSRAYRLNNCVNYGTVNGGNDVGGIAGVGSTYTDCVNYGTVNGGNDVGGICGGGTLERCENKGTVTGIENVGGIAGDPLSIRLCKNSGTVQGEKNIGGIVGRCSGSYTVENVYNVGVVMGGNYVGGIIGFAEDGTYLNTAYNIGEVKSDGIAGALLCSDNFMWGKTFANDCFYEKEKTPKLYGCGYSGVNCDSGGIQAKTASELKQKSTYSERGYSDDGYYYGWEFGSDGGWAFDNTINGGYPCFLWEQHALYGK